MIEFFPRWILLGTSMLRVSRTQLLRLCEIYSSDALDSIVLSTISLRGIYLWDGDILATACSLRRWWAGGQPSRAAVVVMTDAVQRYIQ